MLRAKKSLGQNFLTDTAALERIAAAAGLVSSDTAIEIGPGTGLLTRELLRSDVGKLICYEVDDRAVTLLQHQIKDVRIEIREQDFLEADLSSFGGKLRVIGNIPYYITSPIIFKLVDEREVVKDALLLVQLEVAERLTASPRTKEYGIPTVLINFFGEAKMLFTVKAGSFRPVPKVDSAVIHIDFTRDYFTRKNVPVPEGFIAKDFQKFVRGAFAMRRKMLRNNLKGMLPAETYTDLESQPAVIPYLTRRAEELVIEDFLLLFGATTKRVFL